MEVSRLVVPVAGFGTRMLPITKSIPKEMLPIVDKPIIQYVIEEAIAGGITDIVLITGYHKRAIEDYFDTSFELEELLKRKKQDAMLEKIKNISKLTNLTFVRQKDGLGTAKAIASAEHILQDAPFMVMWGDILADKSRVKLALDAFKKVQNPVMCGQLTQDPDDALNYGYIKGKKQDDGIWSVEGIVEKPGFANRPSDLAVQNGYVLTPDIFDIMRTLKPNAKGEYCLIEAINILAKQRPTYAVEMHDINQYDTGNKLDYMKTVIDYALKDQDIGKDLKTYIRERL